MTTPQIPRGALNCPYCSQRIHNDVAFMGQIITCPSCHGTVRAPGVNQAEHQANMQVANDQMLRGAVTVVVAILLLVFGDQIVGCAMK